MPRTAVTVRPVGENDAPVWLRLRSALWPDDGTAGHSRAIAAFFGGQRREPAEAMVAVSGSGGVLGFVELSIRTIVDGCDTDRVGYLEGWYVVPEWRRRGVGAALVAAAEDWARGQGCTEFASDAEIENAPGLAAHRALGFEETARVVNFRKTLVRS